ncbi:mechanosensitive ion channel family protein [Aquibium oceanicum]|uniref:Small-conductance mechanosensitive channel n=1 Tax=Aquibium oceanicum TaxID=1670800 RepID=A0A1L3SZE7_9HYPH|nr:mechanosensitive ion channel family protein [Aquibium oceanicum]APH74778.1 mechanosensitive ion channel protein MscS [Aquibium oceanicum]
MVSSAEALRAQEPAVDPGEAPAAPRQPVSIENAVEDRAIAERLDDILSSTGWFENATVEVREGVVFLDGAAGSQDHRRWAGELAANTEGTVAVVNRIEVRADLRSTFGRAGEESTRLYGQAVQAWPLVLLALVIALATFLVAALIGRFSRGFLSTRISSPLLRSVVVRAITIPVFLLGIYFVLRVAGLTSLAVTVLGGTGLIGIVIGFAFRDIAENFLASLLLSIRNPFRSGDLIDVAGHVGIVQNLNTRSTVLLTLDGNHVQIPNAMVFKSIIKNYSSIPSRRAEFLVGIGYDSSTAKAQALISEVLREHPAVLETPEPLVLVDQLGAATVDLKVQYWFDSATYSPAKINSALLRLSKNALLSGGIELPDPAREVVFPQGVPFYRRDRPAEKSPASTKQKKSPPVDDQAVTIGEGNLQSETREAAERPRGEIPESSENLLKG